MQVEDAICLAKKRERQMREGELRARADNDKKKEEKID